MNQSMAVPFYGYQLKLGQKVRKVNTREKDTSLSFLIEQWTTIGNYFNIVKALWNEVNGDMKPNNISYTLEHKK